MIKNKAVLQDIQASWDTVRISQAMVQTNLNTVFAFGGVQTHDFKNLCYNLVLIFSFSVLEDTLKQLEHEGVFTAKNRRLGTLMHASKQALPWVAFRVVDEARNRRNDIAHQRQFLERAKCLEYIDAIEDELVAWGVLPTKVQGKYTITVSPTS